MGAIAPGVGSTVEIAEITTGTDGELLTWDASGNPTTVSVGTSGHVLTSNGPGAAPTFQAAATGASPRNEFLASFEDYTATKYTDTVTGTGSFVNSVGGIDGSTGATAGSSAEMRVQRGSGAWAPNLFDTSVEFKMIASLSNSTSDGFVTCAWTGAAAGTQATGAQTSTHVGFMLDTTVLNSSYANGSTHTLTDISSGITVTNTNSYRATLDGTTDIEFWVNGTLADTATTNLPSGAGDTGRMLICKIHNDAAVTTNRAMFIHSLSVSTLNG